MNQSQDLKIKKSFKIYFFITFPLMIAVTLFYIAKTPQLSQSSTSYCGEYNGAVYTGFISCMTDSSIHSYVILKGNFKDAICRENTKKHSATYKIHPYGQKFKVDEPNTLVLVTKDKVVKKHVNNLKSQIEKYKDNEFVEKLFKDLK